MVNGISNAVNGAASFVSRNVGTLALNGKNVTVKALEYKVGQGALYLGMGATTFLLITLASTSFQSRKHKGENLTREQEEKNQKIEIYGNIVVITTFALGFLAAGFTGAYLNKA